MVTKAKPIVKGLSAKQLLKYTPRLFINNAEDVVIKKLEKKETKGGLKAVLALSYSPDSKALKPHKQSVIALDKSVVSGKGFTITKSTRIKCQCSCESFIFAGLEYANWHHGASDIIYGNGDAPTATNPGLRPGLCKHLVRVITKILEKGW
jgi:hypothetical protein